MTATNESAITWFDSLGFGKLYDVERIPYDASYWRNYRAMDKTPMGAALTQARVELVQRYHSGRVVDVGIGGGAFICAHDDARGIDVNPDAIQWMKETETLHDEDEPIEAATFWDSAEHMELNQLMGLLARVHQWCFISMPIYADRADCIASKHFKPGEHLLYFTHDGLVDMMRKAGFTLVEFNDMETVLGREAIGSYAFMRVRW